MEANEFDKCVGWIRCSNVHERNALWKI